MTQSNHVFAAGSFASFQIHRDVGKKSLLLKLQHFAHKCSTLKIDSFIYHLKVASHEILFSASVFFKNPKFEFDEVKC